MFARWWSRSARRPAPRKRFVCPLRLDELEPRTLLSGSGLSAAVLLGLPGSATGLLSAAPDFYKVNVPQGGRLTVTVQPGAAPAGDFHARLSLLDADGQVLAQSDGRSAANPDDLIDLHVPAAPGGTAYYLEVQGLGGSAAAYGLRAGLAPTNAPQQLLDVGRDPRGVVAGHFDGDGTTDLAVTGYYTHDVTVYLGTGDGTFMAGQDLDVGQYPVGIVAGDFNHDGKPDLATANFDGTVSVLFGRGDGTFADAVSYQAGPGATALAAGDFNGDGRLDLAVADSGCNAVVVLTNNGDGTFAATASYAVGSTPDGIVAGDFNGDGHLDLATANAGSDDVSLLPGRGDGTFAPPATFAVGLTPRGLVAADLNHDGKLDLATANNGSDDVSVLLGDGDGTFAGQVRLAAGAGPTAIVAGSFYRGGAADLAVTNGEDGTVSVLCGRGDGTFSAQRVVPVAQTPSSLVAADLNNDGATDLAVNHLGIDATEVVLGNGDGTFRAAPRQSPGAGPVKTVTGDFNRDGTADVAVADSGTHAVTVFLGNGDGTFRFAGTYATGGNSWDIAAGDLTGNGALDLVTADFSGGSVSVLMGRGDGTFGPAAVFPAGPGDTGLVLGDFNGDGRLDVATANSGSDTVSVLFGDGTGRFAPPVNDTVGNGPQALTAADFNHDGRLDLAVANSNDNTVSVLLNDGHGAFMTDVVLPVGLTPRGIAAAALTTSGNVDLAVSNSHSDTVSIYLGDGHGGFTRAADVPTANGPADPAAGPTDLPVGVLVGDFDGDGRPDLATTDVFSDSVTVLHGNGDGTFSLSAEVPTGEALGGSVGDFNADGRLDVVTANKESGDLSMILSRGRGHFLVLPTAVATGPVALATADLTGSGFPALVTADAAAGTVAVRLGNGDGTFQDPITYQVGRGPEAVTLADFNGDGRLDLAVANFLDGTVSVLFGLGDGTFQAQRVYKVGRGPDALATGDFDGDGTPDLAVANYGSGTVTILPGRRDGTFAAPVTVPVGAGPDALAAADLNGDGVPDPVVGDYRSHDVTAVLCDGRGHFYAQAPVGLPAGPTGVTTGDLDGDGVPDVAAACPLAGGVFLLPGQQFATAGVGGYALRGPRLVATAAAPVALAAGDFDNDGRPDLAYADNGANVIGVLLQQPGGAFLAQPTYDVGAYPFGLVAADFNNDGRFDLATANGAGEPVSVPLGLGDGTLADVAQASAPRQSAPVVADLNGDGVPDIVLLRQDGKILFRAGVAGHPGVFRSPVAVNPLPEWAARDIIVGLGPGGRNYLFALSARSDTDALYACFGGRFVMVYAGDLGSVLPSYLLVSDVNGDGLPDLVLASAATGEIDVGLQHPDEDFSETGWSYQVRVSPGISGITLADVSGDGLPDIVVTNQVTGEVELLVNSPDPAAAFSTQLHFRSGGGLAGVEEDDDSLQADPLQLRSDDAPVALVAGPFYGGTAPALAVLNRGTDRVDLLLSDGQGGVFNPDPAASLLTGRDPVALVTGDFNGDGNPDLAVLNKGSDDISVFLGDGHGGFTEQLLTGPDGRPVRLGAGNAPTGLAAADANGDGVPDLLVSNAQGDVLTLLGNGDGTFQPYRRLDDHVALAVADARGGRQEVVFADAALDRVRLVSGQPGGDFVRGRQDGVLKPNAVKLADLNGDGVPDLVVANGGGNDVLVYAGLPGGGFGPARAFFTGTNPVGLTVADLNGDGVPDLVVADQGSNDVAILYGQGRGAAWALVPGPRLGAGSGPVATAVADVNGVPAIFVANGGEDDVYELRGVGGGFFDDRNPIVFATGAAPEALFVGNFDGRLGLVTVNAGSNDLTFFAGFGPGRSIASGGTDPAAAVMGDFRHDGFDDLIVANGDGLFTLLAGGPDGLEPLATLRRPDLGSPSDIALAGLGAGSVSVYVASAGQESAVPLTFALDLSPVLPPPGPAEAPPSFSQAAEFSAVAETALGTVATLVLGPAESAPAAAEPAAEAVVSNAAFVTPSAAPAGVVAAYFDLTSGPDVLPSAPSQAAHEAGLAAFLLGLDDLPFARRLGGGESTAAGAAREPAPWDWLDAAPAPAAPRPATDVDPINWELPPADARPENARPPDPIGDGQGAEAVPPAQEAAPDAVPQRPPLSLLALYVGAGLVVTAADADRRRRC